MKTNAIIKSASLLLLFFLAFTNNTNAQNCNLNVSFAQDQLVLYNDCSYENDSARFSIYITNISGGSGNYTISHSGEGFVTDTQLSTGGKFVYGWSTADQNPSNPSMTNATFTIDDGAGNVCTLNDLEPFIQTQINVIGFDALCDNNADECSNALIHYPNYLINAPVYSSKFVIISQKQLAPNTNLTYESGDFVRLDVGFEAPASTNFVAQINPCSDNSDN